MKLPILTFFCKFRIFLLAALALSGISRDVHAATTFYIYGRDTITIPYNCNFEVAAIRTGGFGADTVYASLSGSPKFTFAVNLSGNRDSVLVWPIATDSAGYRDSLRYVN